MSSTPTVVPRRYPGRLYLLLGLALAVLGIIAYVVQVAAHRLTVPVYLLPSAILGAACVAVALFQARTVVRILALGLVLLIGAAEWTFLHEMKLPRYEGPVKEGSAFPGFKAARADGTAFTQRDLEGDRDTVMVFFRGRW